MTQSSQTGYLHYTYFYLTSVPIGCPIIRIFRTASSTDRKSFLGRCRSGSIRETRVWLLVSQAQPWRSLVFATCFRISPWHEIRIPLHLWHRLKVSDTYISLFLGFTSHKILFLICEKYLFSCHSKSYWNHGGTTQRCRCQRGGRSVPVSLSPLVHAVRCVGFWRRHLVVVLSTSVCLILMLKLTWLTWPLIFVSQKGWKEGGKAKSQDPLLRGSQARGRGQKAERSDRCYLQEGPRSDG